MSAVLDIAASRLAGVPPRRGVCLVLVSPSGGGKTSIMHRLLADPAVSQSVSVTTRPMRAGEAEGRDYYFRTPDEFAVMVAGGGMLEHASVHARSYGIPRAPVEDALASGRDLVFAIDWKGNRTLRAKLPGDVVSVFIVPPSMAELEERLAARGDSEEDVRLRMAEACHELGHWADCDHLVVNDNLDVAVQAVSAILHAARTACHRQTAASALAAQMSRVS